MRVFRLLLAVLLLAAPAGAVAQTFPPLSGRVVDTANLLSPEQEAQLTQLSEDIQKASSRQFVVATVPDLQGYPIEDYGYKLGREWKIGQKDANNGIILLVAPNERKVRIEVGYGLEPIMTDAFSGLIIRNDILPKFRDGDMPGGIMAGAAAIGEQMKLPLEAAEERVKAAIAKSEESQSSGNGGVSVFVILFWVFALAFMVLPAILGRGRKGRRYRGAAGQVGEIVLWSVINAALNSRDDDNDSGWGGGGGGGWGGGGGGGFSCGGGSFGGGGASGSW